MKQKYQKTQNRWEDIAKRVVESLGSGINWKKRAMVGKEWRDECEMGWL